MPRTQTVLSATALLAVAHAAPAQSLFDLSVIAVQDRAVQGMPGATWETLRTPMIDGFGDVAFSSEVRETGFPFDAVFKTDGALLMPVVADDDPAPGVLFAQFDIDRDTPTLASDGRLVLLATLVNSPVSGVDTTNDFVFYEWENGAFTLRFRESQFILNSYKAPANRTPPVRGTPSPGVFAFSGTFDLFGDPNGASRSGVWKYEDNVLTPVALIDDPGIDLIFPGGDWQSFNESAINDSGVMTFGANAGSQNQNVYRWTDGSFETIARSFDSAPDFPGFQFARFLTTDINNQGDVVFTTQFKFFNGGFANFIGIFRGGNGPVENIAVESQPAPGFPAGSVYSELYSYNFDPVPAQNDRGDVLFDAAVGVPGSGMLNGGYFLHRDGVATPIARFRDPLPHGDEISSFNNDPILLDNGDVVFIINASLYAYRDATGQLESVLLAGDTIDLSADTDPAELVMIDRLLSVDIEQNPRTVSARGSFVAHMELTNGDEVIVRGRLINRGCPADIDFDGDVDLGDFGVFGAEFGRTDCAPTTNPCGADLDGAGDVDLGDFGLFGSLFGGACP